MLTLLANNSTRFITIALALSAVGVANAGEVRLTGSTKGAFDAQAYGTTNSLLGLTFSSSTFDDTTVGNSLDFGGNPNPGSNFNNLGSLSLNNVNNTYNGHTFSVQVTFTAPVTIVGGNQSVFTSVLTGTILNNAGGVFIDFNNAPQTFVFSNANATGSFTFAVNDISIAPGQVSSISAHITGNQNPVPEPAAFAGIACGLIGLLGAVRRKK